MPQYLRTKHVIQDSRTYLSFIGTYIPSWRERYSVKDTGNRAVFNLLFREFDIQNRSHLGRYTKVSILF